MWKMRLSTCKYDKYYKKISNSKKPFFVDETINTNFYKGNNPFKNEIWKKEFFSKGTEPTRSLEPVKPKETALQRQYRLLNEENLSSYYVEEVEFVSPFNRIKDLIWKVLSCKLYICKPEDAMVEAVCLCTFSIGVFILVLLF